jgi:hypothetical protein
VSVAGGGPRARRKSSGVGCPCPRLGSGEARSCPLSGPILDLIAPIRPLQLCADGGYQLRLGVLRVPLIMVPDSSRIFCFVRVGRFTKNHRPFTFFLYDDIRYTYFNDVLFCRSFSCCRHMPPAGLVGLRLSSPAILLGLCLVTILSGAQFVLY